MNSRLQRMTLYLISTISIFCITGFINAQAQHIQFSDDVVYGDPCKVPEIHTQIHYIPQTDTVILPSVTRSPFSQLKNFSSPNFGNVPAKLLEVVRTSDRLERYFGPQLKTFIPYSCPRPIPKSVDVDIPRPCSFGYIKALSACMAEVNRITGKKNTLRDCETRPSVSIELAKGVRCMEESLNIGNRYTNVINVFTY